MHRRVLACRLPRQSRSPADARRRGKGERKEEHAGPGRHLEQIQAPGVTGSALTCREEGKEKGDSQYISIVD